MVFWISQIEINTEIFQIHYWRRFLLLNCQSWNTKLKSEYLVLSKLPEYFGWEIFWRSLMHGITYRIWKSRYAMTEKFRLTFKYFDKSQFKWWRCNSSRRLRKSIKSYVLAFSLLRREKKSRLTWAWLSCCWAKNTVKKLDTDHWPFRIWSET